MSLPSSGVDPTRVVGRRFLAWLLDGFVDLLVLLGAVQLLGVDVERQRTTSTVFDARVDADASVLVALAMIAVVWFGVRVALVGSLGWTPGKLALGIRVARWDGRPPGVGRALVRAIVFGAGQALFGCLYWLVALFTMTQSRGHRQPADHVAGTWVIDAWYVGRMLLEGPNGVIAGPPPLTRQEAGRLLDAEGLPSSGATALATPGRRSTRPVFDKARDTYVVWHPRRKQWLQFDRATETWRPLEDIGPGTEPEQGSRL